jgi:hypothetical protein
MTATLLDAPANPAARVDERLTGTSRSRQREDSIEFIAVFDEPISRRK